MNVFPLRSALGGRSWCQMRCHMVGHRVAASQAKALARFLQLTVPEGGVFNSQLQQKHVPTVEKVKSHGQHEPSHLRGCGTCVPSTRHDIGSLP
eukprot:583668-Amphidinium_carterae.2